MKYDEGIRKYRDTICVMDYAIEKGLKEGFDKGMAKGMAEGMAKGMAEGMAEGIAKATIANALSLKKNGVPVEIIANSLGLSIDEVRKL
jgi:predicted transposase/invertase (TIGR01784 family)